MLFAFLFALQLPVPLPPILESWKAEIESRSTKSIEIIRIPGDPIPDQDRQLLLSYFARPDFAENFSRAQALTFRYEIQGRSRSLILLNLPKMQQTQNSPAALIAHELGHLWLASIGLPSTLYKPGPLACLGIHYSNIVQHILIRTESDRRGIDWRPSYIRDYTAASDSLKLEPTGGPGDECLRAQRLSLIIDVITGFEPKSFPARETYLQQLAAQDPAAEALAIELIEELDSKLSLNKDAYASALSAAKSAVARLLGRESLP